MKTVCRKCTSAVHVRYVTSAMSFGLTRSTRESSSGEPYRLLPGCFSSKGIFATAHGLSFPCSDCAVMAFRAALGNIFEQFQNCFATFARDWIITSTRRADRLTDHSVELSDRHRNIKCYG
jgi:hypothetical protein